MLMRTGIIIGLVAALSAAWPASAGVATPPERIVSINMCADELLLALADPSQIADLTPYAADPAMSFMADQAAKHRHDAMEAENVIALKPDLVLGSSFTAPATVQMLSRLGYRLATIDQADSIDASIAQIRQVAELVGHPERGAALVAEIDRARQVAVAAAQGRPRPTAAVYQRRGYVTGGDTLTGELLSIAGFTNEGGALAGKTGGFVPLEKMVAEHPDFIVVTTPDERAVDQGTALLSHPALMRLYPPARRIVLPERLTVCGGPSLPTALRRVSDEAARIERR
jgi:iron complex transport system substrate-binding protein